MATYLQEHEQELVVNQRIVSDQGTYRILQVLGIGGNSQVFLVLAIDGRLRGGLFALKLFVKVSDATRLGRFRQEIDFLGKQDHPSVMRIYDDGEVAGSSKASKMMAYPFVIADYLPKTMGDALRGGLSTVEKLSYALQLLSGLSFLATLNPQVVHRDIKPENIFVKGKACILGDFGLAKLLKAEEEDDKDFIIESVGPRLPRFYRSPDLVNYCRKKVPLTVKSDVFQLGLVLAEMFTGRCPLKACKEIYDDIELDKIDSSTMGSSNRMGIVSQIERMLELTPERRPFASELLDQWEGIFLEAVKSSHQLDGHVF